MLKERINAKGHVNVLALHPTTLEITKDDHLTKQGDCIIAVSSDKGLPDMSQDLLDALKDEKAKLVIDMECGGVKERVTAFGHPGLSFTNPHEMVVRKSSFICPRTLAVKADKSSKELSRDFVKQLALAKPVKIGFSLTC